MIKDLKVFVSGSSGVAKFATFSTTIQGECVDKGRRVKHLIYRFDDCPDAFWHERHFLSEDKNIKPCFDETMFVSERVFFGKYRFVAYRDGALAETWMAVSQCVFEMNKRK